jgi:circadian clock protein KaiB
MKTETNASATIQWHLQLYVASDRPRSMKAISTLERLCEQHVAGRYAIEVVDLSKTPEVARRNQVFAVPFVVRLKPEPEPVKRIAGVSDSDAVCRALGFIA